MKVREFVAKLLQVDQEVEMCEDGDWGIHPLQGNVKQMQVYVHDDDGNCHRGKYCCKETTDSAIKWMEETIKDPSESDNRNLWLDSLVRKELEVTKTIETIVVIS